MKFSFIPIMLLLMTGVLKAETDFRVRILERYHPKEILVSYPESIYEEITINEKSSFPFFLKDETVYTIRIPSKGFKRKYRGRLTFYKGKELIVVNTVSSSSYITSVVISEFGIKSPEAMCAQAVVSRTWAISHLKPDKRWDFNDLTISQVYKGTTPFDKKVYGIISQTGDEVLTFNENLAEIFFHAKCSGKIFSPYEIWGRKIPYIKSGNSQTKVNYRWRTELDEKSLAELFSSQSFIVKRVIIDGRIFVIVNNRHYPVDNFRLKINRKFGWAKIKSTDFSIKKDGKNILFEGKGHGHLVGFCQEGAEYLAKKGHSYRDILSFYYPGASIAGK